MSRSLRFPKISSWYVFGFDHPKVKVHVGDGFKFLEDVANGKNKANGTNSTVEIEKNMVEDSDETELPPRPPETSAYTDITDDDLQPFDVIITDSSDPEGPAAALFQSSFYRLLYDALTSEGIMSCQVSENQWLNLKLIRDLKQSCKTVFL